MSSIVPLDLLKPDEEGHVCSVEGDQEVVARLAEMGLREGVPLKMLQPGQPCIICLNGSRLCFRVTDEVDVLIELTAAGH